METETGVAPARFGLGARVLKVSAREGASVPPGCSGRVKVIHGPFAEPSADGCRWAYQVEFESEPGVDSFVPESRLAPG